MPAPELDLEYDRDAPFKTGLAGACPRCGLDFSQQNSGDAGPFFIVSIVGFIIIGLALTVEMNCSPPMWLHMVLWLLSSLILSLVLLRPAKGIMIALQYRHRVAFENDRDET